MKDKYIKLKDRNTGRDMYIATTYITYVIDVDNHSEIGVASGDYAEVEQSATEVMDMIDAKAPSIKLHFGDQTYEAQTADNEDWWNDEEYDDEDWWGIEDDDADTIKACEPHKEQDAECDKCECLDQCRSNGKTIDCTTASDYRKHFTVGLEGCPKKHTDQDTSDFVKVTRCKDCKYLDYSGLAENILSHALKYHCKINCDEYGYRSSVNLDDYCVWGVRKDDGTH